MFLIVFLPYFKQRRLTLHFAANLLMDLLTEHESYQDLAWSVGVRLRGNLDKIYTWAEKYGLAQDFRKVNLKLSEAADLASDSKFNYRKIILIFQ